MCVSDLDRQIPPGRSLRAPALPRPHGKSGYCPGQHVSAGVWTFGSCLLWISEGNLVHFPLWNLFSVRLNLILATWPISDIYRLLCIFPRSLWYLTMFPMAIIMLSDTQISIQPQFNVDLLQMKSRLLLSLHYTSFPVCKLWSTFNQFALVLKISPMDCRSKQQTPCYLYPSFSQDWLWANLNPLWPIWWGGGGDSQEAQDLNYLPATFGERQAHFSLQSVPVKENHSQVNPTSSFLQERWAKGSVFLDPARKQSNII